MAKLSVSSEKHALVPIRFTRQTSGPPKLGTPSVDDRGYGQGNPLPGWGASQVRGPVVGVTEQTEVTLLLERRSLDRGAALYLTSTAPGVAEVVKPVSGAALGSDGVFSLQAGTGDGVAVLQARLGSPQGPVLGEMVVRVFTRVVIPITAHLLQIDSSGGVFSSGEGTRPEVPIGEAIERVRAYWEPCGIDFHLQPVVESQPIRLPSDVTDQVEVDNLYGMSTRDQDYIFALQRKRLGLGYSAKLETLNIYFVPSFSPHVGQGRASPARVLAATRFTGSNQGVIVGMARIDGPEHLAAVLAHEIGHFLGLAHVRSKEGYAVDAGALSDTDARRRLMFPITILPPAVGGWNSGSPPYWDDVGYGDQKLGGLLTVKNLPCEGLSGRRDDSDCHTARKSALEGSWKLTPSYVVPPDANRKPFGGKEPPPLDKEFELKAFESDLEADAEKGDIYAMVYLGDLAKAKGDPEQALRHYETAMRQNPRNTLVAVRMGDLALEQGDELFKNDPGIDSKEMARSWYEIAAQEGDPVGQQKYEALK